MPESPFSEAFSLDKFYTQSSDQHHHNERANFRCPGDWLHFASVVANSPQCPQYESVSDIMRDGFAKAISVALEQVNDPDAQSSWSLQLSRIELERREARDNNEIDTATLWRTRLAAGFGYEPENFHRDLTLMESPEALREMHSLADRYSL